MSYIKNERDQMYSEIEQKMSIDRPMSSLMLIDFMVTELCNRVCSFCPRATNYPNLNLNMSLDLIEKIAKELKEFDYQGRLLFCGFGESLLYKDLAQAFTILKTHLPNNHQLHLVTNGDRLTINKIKELVAAGLDRFYVSLYDGKDQISFFENMFHDAGVGPDKFFLQHYYLPKEQNYGFVKLSNRAGMLYEEKHDGICNIPFYALSVHWDGKVLLCSHDWHKSVIAGDLNIESIQNIWLNSVELNKYRAMLAQGKRDCGPCNRCNIFGNLYGNKSRAILSPRSSVD